MNCYDGPPLYSYTRIGCMQEERLQEHRLVWSGGFSNYKERSAAAETTPM